MVTSRRADTDVAGQKSESVAHGVDPRVERTQACIGAAFFALLSRRTYGRISVSSIASKAGIGRATFYAHFESKDALLRSELQRVVLPMLMELPGDPCLVDCTALFGHVQHARAIYRSLTSGTTRVITERIVQDAFEERIHAILLGRVARGAAPRRGSPGFVSRFVAGTILAMIAWALEQDEASSPVRMQATYRLLVGSALAAAMPA
jgi:AcrR family transcriptional regulator